MVKTTSRSHRPWSTIFCVIVYHCTHAFIGNIATVFTSGRLRSHVFAQFLENFYRLVPGQVLWHTTGETVLPLDELDRRCWLSSSLTVSWYLMILLLMSSWSLHAECHLTHETRAEFTLLFLTWCYILASLVSIHFLLQMGWKKWRRYFCIVWNKTMQTFDIVSKKTSVQV